MIQSLPTTKNQAVNLLESENTYFSIATFSILRTNKRNQKNKIN